MKILPLRSSIKIPVILQTKPVHATVSGSILCGHTIKILDLMNIKSLPAQYILKRWTREARSGTVQDNQGRNIIENPKLDDMLRYRYMTRKFLNLAHRAVCHLGCTY